MAFVYYLDIFSFFKVIKNKKVYYINTSYCFRYIISLFRLTKFIDFNTKDLNDFSHIHSNSLNDVSEFVLINQKKLESLNLIRELKNIINIDNEALFSTVVKSYSYMYIKDIIIFLNIIKYHHKNMDNIKIIFNTSDNLIEEILQKQYKIDKIYSPFNVKSFIKYYRLLFLSIYRLFNKKTIYNSSAKYECTTELIDLDKFNKEPGQPNYVEKLLNIQTNQVLYYYFSQAGFHPKVKNDNLVQFIKDKQINCINLDDLKSKTISKAFVVRSMLKSIFFNSSYLERELYVRLLMQWYGYTALFDNNLKIHTTVYLTLPNSNTAWRTNSGMVTGIARQFQTKSIGYQTRLYYIYTYEYMFDAYDTFYYFDGWKDCIKKYDIFVKDKEIIDNFYLKSLKKIDNDVTIVSVFPTDLSPNHHYNYAYNKLFFKNLFQLLDLDDNFVLHIKSKDVVLIDKYKEFDCYKRYNELYKNRIIFLNKQRDDITSVIEQSDIIVGIGFTNPLIIAAQSNKPVLIFEQIENYNKCLDKLGMKITNTTQEFQKQFIVLLNKNKDKKCIY